MVAVRMTRSDCIALEAVDAAAGLMVSVLHLDPPREGENRHPNGREAWEILHAILRRLSVR